MCIAILNKKNTLPQNYLENSFDNNSQGSGLMYVLKGKLTTFKTYQKNELISKYYEIREKINTPIVLHFRIATSGFSELNLHPFLVNKDLGFVHNGVIYGLGNKDYSDTYQFNEILKKLPNNFLYNIGINELITKLIDKDKLIFLDSKNSYKIVNEVCGHWDKLGNWFSNDSYKQKNSYVYAGNKKVYDSVFYDDFFDSEKPDKKEYLFDLYGVQNDKDLNENILFEGFKDVNECFNYYYNNYGI
jgi:predicted glutamine amidotransferase